jgi:hypothetical protein
VARSFIHAAANGAPPRGFHQSVDRTLIPRSDHSFSVQRRGFTRSRLATVSASVISDGPLGNGAAGWNGSASTNSNSFSHPSTGTYRDGSEKGASIAAAENCFAAKMSARSWNGDRVPSNSCTDRSSVTRGFWSLGHLTRQTQMFEVALEARHHQRLLREMLRRQSARCALSHSLR